MPYGTPENQTENAVFGTRVGSVASPAFQLEVIYRADSQDGLTTQQRKDAFQAFIDLIDASEDWDLPGTVSMSYTTVEWVTPTP